jgi:Spy/CpxP family protein refolding chaperone
VLDQSPPIKELTMPFQLPNRVLFVSALVILAATPCAFAQGPPPGMTDPSMTVEEFVKERMSDLTTILGLTLEQQELVTPIIESDVTRKREAMESARDKGRRGMRELKKAIDEIDEETEDALAEVLSKEQVKAYTEWLEEQRKEQRERFRGHRGGRGGR